MTQGTFQARQQGGQTCIALTGQWTLAALPQPIALVEVRLRETMQHAKNIQWDLQEIARIDSVGALLLWRLWAKRWPEDIKIQTSQRAVFERIMALPSVHAALPKRDFFSGVRALGYLSFAVLKHARDIVALIGQLALDVLYLCAHPREMPWREFSANLYKSGAQALPVTALVGFLIGIVLSYLSSLQLKTFGADIFIVNLLGISIIRELGPVIVAVLVAGRSGSAMTAQIGVMRVTEEIDALATMGVSRSLRLILPKILALTLAMPLLVVWCAAAGLIGGMVSANLEMGLSYGFFIDTLPKVVPFANLWIGLAKGFLFGFLISVIACHFGLKVLPNTESLSSKTTAAVVSAITIVIVADAVFAIMTRGLGMPGGL